MTHVSIKKKRITPNLAVAAAILIIMIGSGLLDYYSPVVGDDLMFWNNLGLYEYEFPNRSTVSFILGHYFGCNGRFFDIMGPIVTNMLPRWMSSIIMGAMSGLFFFSVLFVSKVPRNRYITFSLVLLAITLAVMPWWDTLLRVCHFNYTWSATFCLLTIGFFFRDTSMSPNKIQICALFLLGVFAGSSHEQTGIAMCSAFFIWYLVAGRFRTLSLHRKALLIGILVGTIFSISSPSLWTRVSSNNSQVPWDLLVFTTLPILVLLLLVCIGLFFFHEGRRCIKCLIDGRWGVLTVCAVVSGIIALASGINGRTGFLPESCSLCALAIMALHVHIQINRPVAVVTSILAMSWIIIHFTISVLEQQKLGIEFKEMLDAYITSPDGIIYFDFSKRYDGSPMTLNRVKGVPDADDLWLLHTIGKTYGSPYKAPVIIPLYFKDRLETMTDSVTNGEVTVYAAKPTRCIITEDSVMLQNYPGPMPRVVTATHMSNGKEIWVATPRVRDPGDYE